jgi:4-aminobutyrate aminotransferase
LRQLASKYGILLVADEVQSGMGRTGRMFAIEHYKVVPDIITLAKGIASGLPLGAIIAPRDIMTWPPGSHGSTFGGNPVSCAAALATIDLLERRLVKNSERMGKYIMKRLVRIQEESRSIGRLAGKGLMIGMEIVKSKASMEPAPRLRSRIVDNAFWHGLLLLPCGSTSLRFVPPLVIGRREADTALEIFEECVRLAEKRR